VSGLAVRVAKNCCVNLYRKRQSAKQQHFEDISPRMLRQEDTADSPQERLEAQDTQRMMDEVVALLKPRERQLFEMRQTEGLSTADIAEQTGIPKASVAVMLSTARKKVLTELTRRMKL
jgi:RNA polymerase sigma factor (sigma-70 family)